MSSLGGSTNFAVFCVPRSKYKFGVFGIFTVAVRMHKNYPHARSVLPRNFVISAKCIFFCLTFRATIGDSDQKIDINRNSNSK